MSENWESTNFCSYLCNFSIVFHRHSLTAIVYNSFYYLRFFILFLGRSLTCDEILALLEEDCSTAIYIEPPDDNITDEDFGDEDGGGYIKNLSGKQLLAPSEAVSSSDRQITAVDDDPNLEYHSKYNIPK